MGDYDYYSSNATHYISDADRKKHSERTAESSAKKEFKYERKKNNEYVREAHSRIANIAEVPNENMAFYTTAKYTDIQNTFEYTNRKLDELERKNISWQERSKQAKLENNYMVVESSYQITAQVKKDEGTRLAKSR